MDRLHSALNRISQRQQAMPDAVESIALVKPGANRAEESVATLTSAEIQPAKKSRETERAADVLDQIEQSLDALLAELAIDEQQIQVLPLPSEVTTVSLPPGADYSLETEAAPGFAELELPPNPPLNFSSPLPAEPTEVAAESQLPEASAPVAQLVEDLKEEVREVEKADFERIEDEREENFQNQAEVGSSSENGRILMPGPSWRPRPLETPTPPRPEIEPPTVASRSFLDLVNEAVPEPAAAVSNASATPEQPETSVPFATPEPAVATSAVDSLPLLAELEGEIEPVQDLPLEPAAFAASVVVVEPAPVAQVANEQPSPVDELRDQMTSDLAVGQAHTIALVAVEGSANRGSAAALLAKSFARLGSGSVLAVDASFGASQLAADLGAPPAPGLIEWLAEASGETVRKILPSETRTAGVSFLGSGVGANPDLTSGDLRWLQFDLECRESHRWTIIDAGDVGGAAATYASLCDAAYLVICLQETPRREANLAIQKLHEAGVPLRGCILIGDDATLASDGSPIVKP